MIAAVALRVLLLAVGIVATVPLRSPLLSVAAEQRVHMTRGIVAPRIGRAAVM